MAFIFFQSLLNYKSFHFCPSSQHSPTPSPSLRAVRVSCPVGSSSSSPLPPGPGRWASKQTGSSKSSICRGNKSQCHCQWLFRKTPGQPHSENPATFSESGWIMCCFSPSPTGLGELSLDQYPCISAWTHPSRPDFLFHVLPPPAPHLDLGGLSPVLQCGSPSVSPSAWGYLITGYVAKRSLFVLFVFHFCYLLVLDIYNTKLSFGMHFHPVIKLASLNRLILSLSISPLSLLPLPYWWWKEWTHAY